MDSKLLKKLFVAVLVIMVLVLGVLVINKYFDGIADSSTSNLLLGNAKLEDIKSFEYVLPDKDLKFTRKDNLWYVNDYLASNRVVEIALSKLLAVELSYIVSDNSDSYSTYQVDSNTSELVVDTNSKSYTVLIGKNTFENGSFLRFDNTTRTYGSNVSINSILDNDLGYFRDKTITSLDQNQIELFKINQNEYKKTNGEWSKNNKTITNQSINNLLYVLANINGIAFADSKDVSTLENSTLDLSLTIQTSTKTYNVIYIKYKENNYVKSDDSEYLITLDSVLQQIKQTDLDL